MIEKWKFIAGYTGLYSISNTGRVINYQTGKELKPAVNHKGYLIAQLSIKGQRKNKRIHRLVAEAFIPNPDNLPEVDHIDNNKQNNNVDNLRWVTGSCNTRNREVCMRATSKYNGVRFNESSGKYLACVQVEGKSKHLGTFTEETHAALAFNRFCLENGLNRELNLIEEA